MTRINVGVDPRELPDRLLIAEHREIKRIPNAIAAGKYKLTSAPARFCLGKGHVAFFYDKQRYLYERYRELYLECRVRGFRVQDYKEAWNGVPSHLFNGYKPSKRDRRLIVERIRSKGYTLIH